MSDSRLMDLEKIRRWLKEDIGQGDITSNALIPEDVRGRARLFTREKAVVAGIAEVRRIFELLGCEVKTEVGQGEKVEPGEPILYVEGAARSILSGERQALNIFQRMTSIATKTRTLQDEASKVNPDVKVAATRKTIPGLREKDKRAVEIGGGDTHRLRLDDCVLIKDNHLTLLPSIGEAIKKAKRKVSFTKKIEVEVRCHQDALEAAKEGADIIMYDNMSPEEIIDSMKKLDEDGLRKGRIFEASGGITESNLKEYASTGVDIISLGSLTHSVVCLDVKLEIEMI
ncbi:MAG: carboxylating nicotinate-nucleotide diphosphorylase [Candidatus Bathyarchaeia archaeon]